MFSLTYNGKSFNQRESDNYVNVGQLCAIHEKLFGNWKQLKSAKEYVEALSVDIGIPITELLVTIQGGISTEQGTWAHPLIALEVARWISPKFAIWCNKHIKTLMETGTTDLINEVHQEPERVLPKRDMVEYIDAANKLQNLEDGLLKQLLTDGLTDQISLEQNLKYLPVAEKPKQYTIVKVRAQQLGYTTAQIGNGSQLGKFVRSQIEPAFQEIVGRFPTYHYEITKELDEIINNYFTH